jgi:hypothetical protein
MRYYYYVKDYADGWIECPNAHEAGKLSHQMGNARILVTDLTPEDLVALASRRSALSATKHDEK